MRGTGADRLVVAVRPGNAGGAKGAGSSWLVGRSTATSLSWEEPVSESKPNGKPFAVSKRLVWEAWLRVKANAGAAGVDGESLQAFEANLAGNLYKLWNRLCAGC